MYDDSREDFFNRTLEKTCESYGNDQDDKWFVEAVRHRIVDSGMIIQASMYGELVAYVGVDLLPDPGIIAYVGIATVFEEHKREGLLQALFEPLTQYDGLLIRTQNPSVAYAVYRKFGMVMPLTEKPSIEARLAGECLNRIESNAWAKGLECESTLFAPPPPPTTYFYNGETMVTKGIYNGRRLTKNYKPRSSNRWFNEAMDSINMKLLVVCHTHGDETIGTKIKSYCDTHNINCLIANELARKEKKRFIDEDLNRVFGKRSNTLEGRLWPKIQERMKPYNLVLDVHSTTTGSPNAAIITKDTPAHYLRALLCENVVKINMPNSLIHHAPKFGIALEYGGDENQTEKKVIAAIENICKKRSDQKQANPDFWEVSEIVPRPQGFSLAKKFKDYEPIEPWQMLATDEKNHAISYPNNYFSFLLGHESYTDIFGFLLKKS